MQHDSLAKYVQHNDGKDHEPLAIQNAAAARSLPSFPNSDDSLVYLVSCHYVSSSPAFNRVLGV